MGERAAHPEALGGTSRAWRRGAAEGLAVLACVALALWTYRVALKGYFSPDDLILLERVQGLAPQPFTLWRYLSGQAYFHLAGRWLGVDPFPYLLVNWLLHGLNVVLLYALVRRLGGGVAAGALAAGLFGTSRLFLTVVSQAVGVGELLSLTFSLVAAVALTARSAGRLLAAPSFALALLSKETVILVPAALALAPAVGRSAGARFRRVGPLLAVGALWAAYLAASGVREFAFGGRPYETRLGFNLFHSLMSFAGWSVDLWSVTPDYSGEISVSAWQRGLWVVGALAALAWVARRRTRLPLVGAAWWVLALLPVLPLLWQRYLHYLYVPSAGMAMALAGGLEWALARGAAPPSGAPARDAQGKRGPKRVGTKTGIARTRPDGTRPGGRAGSRSFDRWRRIVALGLVPAVVLGHAKLSDALLLRRFEEKLPRVDIPFDPFVRKMELIRRVSTRVGPAVGDRPVRIVFYIPEGGPMEFYRGLLLSVLDHGRGLRALHPTIDSVAFVARWASGYRDFELFAGSVDGLVEPMGKGPDAHLRLAEMLQRYRFPEEAREHLAAASEAYPEEPRLSLAYAAALLAAGDARRALLELERAAAIEPRSWAADSARRLLEAVRRERRPRS